MFVFYSICWRFWIFNNVVFFPSSFWFNACIENKSLGYIAICWFNWFDLLFSVGWFFTNYDWFLQHFYNIFTCNLLVVTTEKTEIMNRFVCLFTSFEVAFLFLGKKSHYVSINADAYNQTPLTLSGNDSSVYF